MPRRRRSTVMALSACALLVGLAGGTGCGAYAVDDGLYPLPAIHIVWPIPEQFGIQAESRTLTNASGGELFAWFIPAENAKATVLLHHGALTNRSTTFAHYTLLHESGYNVFVYDYQGFGESWVLADITTVLPDADAALAHLQQRDEPGTDKIIIYGQSMGTLPAIAQAARSPDRVIGLVVEGSFSETLPTWAYTLLGVTPDPIAYERIPDELNSAMNIANVTLPKRFIQSRDDRTTPIDGARYLFDLAPDPKSFVEVTGPHLWAVQLDSTYANALISYLDELSGD